MTPLANNIFTQLTKDFPNPKVELNSTNNFTLLVAIVLSAQATDVSVNKATNELFKIVSTPTDMLNLGEESLKKYIKSIGLYNTKAKNIILLSKLLIDNHNSIVPNDRAILEKLPGVGRKTANVLLNVAFGEPTIAVDTHVFRVSNRTGLVKAKTPLQTELQLLKAIPNAFIMNAHILLILHGRYICKAQKPNCLTCSLQKWCKYFKNTYSK